MIKLSKKKALLGFILFFIVGISYANLTVEAHSPGSMSLSYSTNTSELSATITHNVGDPNTHYIDTVIIRVNGSIVQTEIYTSQPTSSQFTYNYNLVANIGANIQVNAECNQGGSISRSIVVEEGTTETPDGSIPGFAGFLLITSISIIIVSIFIYKQKTGVVKECH